MQKKNIGEFTKEKEEERLYQSPESQFSGARKAGGHAWK